MVAGSEGARSIEGAKHVGINSFVQMTNNTRITRDVYSNKISRCSRDATVTARHAEPNAATNSHSLVSRGQTGGSCYVATEAWQTRTYVRAS